MTRLLILGAHGQVGSALTARALEAGIPFDAPGRAQCDITDRSAIERFLAPGCVVVNCAAYTAVDRAEREVEGANHVNIVGADNVAVSCARADVPLIHLSTDYVFAGESRAPIREDEPPRPLNVYGRSKLDGEIAVRQRLPTHIILRTSWVFSTHGQNFVKTILRLADAQPRLQVIDDQIGGPTAAEDIAKAILDIVAVSRKSGFTGWGTYHFAGVPPVSWYEFARAIVADRAVAVVPIAARDYPAAARRPANSVLDCARVGRVFGIVQPDWRPALRSVLEKLSGTFRHRTDDRSNCSDENLRATDRNSLSSSA